MSEGKVHGGTSVWQAIRQALPFGAARTSVPPSAAKPAGDAAKRLDVHANGSAVESMTAACRVASESSDSDPPTATADHSEAVQQSAAPLPPPSTDFGYQRNLERRFRVKEELARGGNGVVTLVVDAQTGQEWAMKSLPKMLSDPGLSERKRLDHQDAIRREVAVLRRLRGCLNVASLEEVYEDDSRVHIVMELCRGGELHHRIGAAHYSERTVASFMRAALRTLAQCHANKILHRDIKPGNFLLSSDDERAPLKAVDFGLAVFYDDKKLPRGDLGFEGTPWYMAPEVLSSAVVPASDIWSAGVMAHQLLTGRFPFDDRTNPSSPCLTKIWKSILTDKVDFSRSHWDGISEEAKDFVAALLNRDPTKRPTAKEALKHPWLQGRIEERSSGRPLSLAVVQRIQRHSQASLFKRSVLEMIAEELLAEGPEAEGPPGDGAAASPVAACPLSTNARALITDPSASPLEYLYERLRLVDRNLVDREALALGLGELGYRLTPEEVSRLLDQLDPAHTGHVAKSQFAASQIDWAEVQESQTERWLRCARRAFADLDADKDGVLSCEDMLALLRHKLPAADVEGAIRQALEEAARRREGSSADGSSHHGSAGGAGGGGSAHGAGRGAGPGSADTSLRSGLNFRQFMRMLAVGSADSLDMYDDRCGGSVGRPGSVGSPPLPGSLDRVHLLLERSIKGGEGYHRTAHLEPVEEAPGA